MMKEHARYTPADIEPKWQHRWDEEQSFCAQRRPGRPKIYVLDMFPYPSGSGLHVGHPEGYTATDIVARYKRMRGYDVLHPMGWDAFGLPAEQYAIETGTHPAITTAKNIATFKRQLKSLGFSYDWSREINTTDPDYVRWTQTIFLKLFEKGLAYQAEIPVNWCPALGTVLANEEVIDGKSERGGYPVVRQPLRQWMLRITAYADSLASDLEGLDWPDTKLKQLHWIGRSEGAYIRFAIEGVPDTVQVFTTRPDTLFGCTYLILAPEHPLVEHVVTLEQQQAVREYRAEMMSKSDLDRTSLNKKKTGIFTGAYAIHPFSKKRIPIWIADFVLGAYGTGAIMSVPAHDERDFEFAKAFQLPIVEVVSSDGQLHDTTAWTEAFTGSGVCVRSDLLDGKTTPEAKQAMIATLEEQKIGERNVQYRLRDWVFSRQRYWGEPIPIFFPIELDAGVNDPRTGSHVIHFDKPIAVTESELPLRLPELDDFRPSGDPSGPLARAIDWRFFQKDGCWYARETNTMPQWAGSCWYYLRYLDPHNDQVGWSPEAYKAWMPVDLYIGGAEQAVLHLLYARFWHKVLYDCGSVFDKEPFQKLVHQGPILGETQTESGPVFEKMSKSKGNVINPDDVIKEYGADTLRVYEMFMGPLEQVKPWQTSGLIGVRRFLDRVWTACAFAHTEEPLDPETLRLLHKTIQKVGDDIEQLRFNTAISALMVLVNRLLELPHVPQNAAATYALLLAPFAPHLAEEIWERLGHCSSLTLAPWPMFDPLLVVDEEVEIGVQVNGKVRSRVTLRKDATEAEARAVLVGDPKVEQFTKNKVEKKFLYVPGKIINIVVADRLQKSFWHTSKKMKKSICLAK